MQIEQQISRIGQKLQQLVKRCAELEADNEMLRRQLSVSENNRQQIAAQVMDLQNNILTLRSALGQLSDDEKKLFEKRINAYIRDIEKAMALLGE
jgi:regulator of replication initiation timing